MGKIKIDSVSSIDIRKLKFSKDATALRLTCGHLKQVIRLTKTCCNYGGYRCWFMCPACHRRMAVLYLLGDIKCRKCHGLVYNTERDTKIKRQHRKANKIRRRLGWQPGIANLDWEKPKGMHWKTFYRLRAKENYTAQCIMTGINQWVVGLDKGRK